MDSCFLLGPIIWDKIRPRVLHRLFRQTPVHLAGGRVKIPGSETLRP